MENRTLQVQTTLLNSFVREDSTVYVKMGDSYMQKKARDLHEGDKIVVSNDAIHKTLEDILLVLDQSMRYRIAKETLHRKNSKGKDIKLFRLLLLQGLVAENLPEKDKKMLMEDLDFSRNEYSSFVAEIQKHVPDISYAAARNWVAGHTLAPEKWDTFHSLEPINSDFAEITQSFGKPVGYHAAYHLYVGIRRGIMAYLAKRGARTADKTTVQDISGTAQIEDITDVTNQPRQPSISLAPEIEMVVRHFVDEIDYEKSGARVTKIMVVEKIKPTERHPAEPEPHLSKGVYTKEMNLPLLGMQTIFDRKYLLSTALYDLLNSYVTSGHNAEFWKASEELAVSMLPASFYLFTKVIKNSDFEKYFYKNNAEVAMQIALKKGKHITDQGIEACLNRFYEKFMAELKEGKIDTMFEMAPNTTSNLIDVLTMYRSGIPKTYFEKEIISARVNITSARLAKEKLARNEKRALETERRHLAQKGEKKDKYLGETYGAVGAQKRILTSFLNERKSLGEWGEGSNLTDEDFVKSREHYEKQGIEFFRKEEVREILGKLGVPDAIKLYEPRTFL